MNSTNMTIKIRPAEWVPIELMPYVALNMLGIVVGVFGIRLFENFFNYLFFNYTLFFNC